MSDGIVMRVDEALVAGEPRDVSSQVTQNYFTVTSFPKWVLWILALQPVDPV